VNTAFIDASAWVALYHKKDNHHERAWKVYEGLLDEGTKFLTSNWIAYEALSILKSRASYEAAKSLWDILCDSELSRNVYIDRTLEDKSVELFW
jgi:predicted nucleic acid-binding protein